MSVGAISSLTSIASASSSSSTSSASAASSALNMDFTTYLKILTTQLQNQDPTNATDPNQFTQELIEMEQVQAQINNNKTMEALTKSTSANGLATGVTYIGNYVRAPTTDGEFSLQSGSSEIGYTLSGADKNATITIKNSSGTTVATLNGGTAKGDNYVSWSGAETDGTTASDGTYTFTVTATDSSGSSLTVSNQSALFKVTSLQSNSDGTLTLNAGDLSLLSSDVTGVFTSATKPTATAATLVTSSSSS